MTTIVWAMIVSSLQVGLLGLGLWPLFRLVHRQQVVGTPVLMVLLASGLGLCGLLMVPEPSWPDLLDAIPVGQANPEEATPRQGGFVLAPSPEWENGIVPSWNWLKRLPPGLTSTDYSASDSWTIIFCFVGRLLLLGSLLNLGWQLLGLRAAGRLARQAEGVSDSGLLAECQSLATSLGIRTPIRLAVTPSVAPAATVGWRRPVVLLHPDWVAWTSAERQSVLAHELAHIQRQDFACWLLARLLTSVHYFHPTMHWLLRELRLVQEVSADARAAELVGGRQRYLVALAKLALRPPVQSAVPGLARPLLAGRKLFSWRIAMLRTKDGTQATQQQRWSRIGMIGVVLVGTIAVSTLRGQGAAETRTLSQMSADTLVSNEPRPLDLSYLPEDALAVFVLRHHPRMENLPIPGLQGLPLQKLDQVAGVATMFYNPAAPHGHRRSLMLQVRIVRFREPIDWPTLARQYRDQMKTRNYAGKQYQRLKAGPLFGVLPSCVYALDDRTLILDEEAGIRAIIDGKVATMPSWVCNWSRVQNSQIGLAINGMYFAEELNARLLDRNDPIEAHWLTFFKVVRTLSLGIDWDRQSSTVQVVLPQITSKHAKQIEDRFTEVLNFLDAKSPKQSSWSRLLRDLRSSREFIRHHSAAEQSWCGIRANAAISLGQLLEGEMFQQK